MTALFLAQQIRRCRRQIAPGIRQELCEVPAQCTEERRRLMLSSGFLLFLQCLNGVFVRAHGKRVKI